MNGTKKAYMSPGDSSGLLWPTAEIPRSSSSSSTVAGSPSTDHVPNGWLSARGIDAKDEYMPMLGEGDDEIDDETDDYRRSSDAFQVTNEHKLFRKLSRRRCRPWVIGVILCTVFVL